MRIWNVVINFDLNKRGSHDDIAKINFENNISQFVLKSKNFTKH